MRTRQPMPFAEGQRRLRAKKREETKKLPKWPCSDVNKTLPALPHCYCLPLRHKMEAGGGGGCLRM